MLDFKMIEKHPCSKPLSVVFNYSQAQINTAFSPKMTTFKVFLKPTTRNLSYGDIPLQYSTGQIWNYA
jgi:hypothetical protein